MAYKDTPGMEQQLEGTKHPLHLPPRKYKPNSPSEVFDMVKNKHHKVTQMKNNNVLFRDRLLQCITYAICEEIYVNNIGFYAFSDSIQLNLLWKSDMSMWSSV
jgi:predicted double-glycine peptidase